MSWLPTLSLGGECQRLPLADGSALLLAELLVAGSSTALTQRLRSALAVDPALAAWCILQAPPSPPATVSKLADWLACQGGHCLTWAENRSNLLESNSAPTSTSHPFSWAELASQSVQVAETAALLAESRQIDRESAYLAGLLSGLNLWLAPQEKAATAVEEAILDAIGCGEVAHQAAQDASHIVRSGQPWPKGIRRPRQQLQQAADLARLHWTQTAPGAADWLPILAARLRRGNELETAFQHRLEQEKLESLAEFAAGAGHEMNNPLAVISGRAQLLLRDEPNPERRRELALIHAQALRVHEMIADLMLYARPPRPRLESADLAGLLARLAEEIAEKAAERRISLRYDIATGPLHVAADANQLLVALRCVCDNAMAAIGADGEIAIRARLSAPDTPETDSDDSQPEQPGMAVVTIGDNGPGIPPEARRHAFDPYFSGQSAGRGLGLGLSKCWRIVQLHGGQVDISSTPGSRGATVVIQLPLT
ncbi:MAG: sensor histidine kinase [Pirellulales bacterium]